jgi:hypothetical protein
MEEFFHTHYYFTFVVSVAVGMISHYVKKRAKEETLVSLKDWFGSVNVFGTLCSFGTSLLATMSALSYDVVTPEMSLSTIFYIGLTTGYAADSATNSADEAKQ